MSHEINNMLDVLRMAHNMLGKPGPMVINSGIAAHGWVEDSDQFDIHIVGKEGNEIQMMDILLVLVDIENQEPREGRSYFFEGIKKVNATTWKFCWGS